jgi:hypothetical protein
MLSLFDAIPDVSNSTIFPWYCTTPADQFEMAYWCEAELAAWREACETHKRLPTITAKLANRRTLETAFDSLKNHYMAAINQDRLVA